MPESKFVKHYRAKRKAQRMLGLERRDAGDRYNFMQQCVSTLVDEGSDPDEAEMICNVLYDEGEAELELWD